MTDQQSLATPLLDAGELGAIVTELLDALLVNAEMDIDPEIAAIAPGSDHAPLSGTVIINAKQPGRLTIDTDVASCEALARCWGLVGPEGPTHQDATDALGELVNLVGGTVKSVFDEETFVGIPEVNEGSGAEPVSPATQIDHTLGSFSMRFALA